MEISFAIAKFQKLCNSNTKLRGELGPTCAERLMRRLAELSAAECLEDLRYLPQARCHELKGDRRGQLAVDLEHPKRLIFEPDHNPRPQTPQGGLEWRLVTKVRIMEIADYH